MFSLFGGTHLLKILLPFRLLSSVEFLGTGSRYIGLINGPQFSMYPKGNRPYVLCCYMYPHSTSATHKPIVFLQIEAHKQFPAKPNKKCRALKVRSSTAKDGADNTKQSTADMMAFVQNLFQQMQSRFQTLSESIITKIDEMGNRIDELEQSINDLRAEMGQEGSPSAPLKATEDEDS